jgi:preprotein translocase subunit SecE
VAQQQENTPNKPVHLMYLCGAVVCFYVSQWTIDWLWGYVARPPSETTISLIAGVFTLTLAFTLYRSDRIHGLANEVAAELKKVTWPSAKEVRAATMVVIVMAVLSAAILGLFDMVWSNLTELIYG